MLRVVLEGNTKANPTGGGQIESINAAQFARILQPPDDDLSSRDWLAATPSQAEFHLIRGSTSRPGTADFFATIRGVPLTDTAIVEVSKVLPAPWAHVVVEYYAGS